MNTVEVRHCSHLVVLPAWRIGEFLNRLICPLQNGTQQRRRGGGERERERERERELIPENFNTKDSLK